MNTNSNVYTVVYTTVICVLVAAILAFVSQSLKPKQEANEKAETISQILTAGRFGEKEELAKKGNKAIIKMFQNELDHAALVNAEGRRSAIWTKLTLRFTALPTLRPKATN